MVKINKSAVILVGTSPECLFSLKQILNSECNVMGVVFCEHTSLIHRIKSEYKRIIKYGFIRRLSQITLAIIYKIIFGRSDKSYIKNCFNNITLNDIYDELAKNKITHISTEKYDSQKGIDFIKNKNPDFLVCHTPYWIDKKVRILPNDGLVIGGHPGIVPAYRGSHSAFWSIFDECPRKNGYSIFCIDHGVDSGSIIHQKHIEYDYNISYRSNDYLLMKLISFALAEVAEEYSRGIQILSKPQTNLLKSQIRTAPGILDFLKFQLKLRNKN